MEIHAENVIQHAQSVTEAAPQTVRNAMKVITLIIFRMMVHVCRIVRKINGKIGRINFILYVVCVIIDVPDVSVRITGNVLNVKLDII